MEYHGEGCSLKEESNALPSISLLDSIVGGIENMFFDQYALSIDFSTTQSLEIIVVNEVVPEHMDIDICLVLVTNIDTRETFWNMYSETLGLYLLYPNLFN